jgi:predicted  nucleic acid-binding Zn-ribbon protein
LNKHLQELIELSKIDKSIDDFTPLIVAAQKKLDRKVTKRDNIAKQLNELNLVIEDINSKILSYEEQIKALNEQLTLGVAKEREVKTEKEGKALQMESELAKEKLNHANEEIARQNKILEVKNQEIADVTVEFESANAEVEKVSAIVTEKLNSIEEDKGRLFATRESHTMTIDQKILSFYEKIRIWAKNTAVVPVRKQACYGCYMKLNDSAYAAIIKSEEINTCHHCGRILYLEPQTAEA